MNDRRLQTKVSEKIEERIKNICEKEGCTISEWLRIIIYTELLNNETTIKNK